MGLQRFPIQQFRGVNLLSDSLALETYEAQDLLNVQADLAGTLYSRAGKTRLDDSGFPASVRAEHLRPWYFGSTRLLLASIDGDIYSMTPDSGSRVLTQRFNGTSGKTWDIETATDGSGNDRAWFLNGTDAAQKWDGATGTTSAWANSPPNGTMLRVWKNRMCIAGVAANPQRLFFSDIGNPEAPSAAYGTNWVDIKSTEDDLDPITWFEVLSDFLIIFKRQSVWAVFDSTTFSNRRIGSPGCEGRFQSVETQGRVWFLNRQGIWTTDGEEAPDIQSSLLSPLFSQMPAAQVSKARMGTTPGGSVLTAIPVGAVTANNRVIEINPQGHKMSDGARPAFIHDYPVSSFATFRPSVGGIEQADSTVAGDSGATKLHTLFSGLSDDGVAINSYWLTGWKKFISEEPFERLRRLNVIHQGLLQVDVYEDFDLTTPKFTGSVENAIMALSRHRPESRGRYHAIKFSNTTLNKTFKLAASEVAFRGGKEH